MSVCVRNVVKRFVVGPGAAVDDVSFEAPSGRITSLLGPSGSGKSTLLRMVAGLETPDSGCIEIDGKDATVTPARERQIGLVFQSYALFGHMTVRENVGFGLRIRRRAKKDVDARVTELLELIQLADLGHRLPSELSGGQRQRVALARALAVDPRVLLLDEPFGALDAKVRVELREWLHELHKKTRLTTLLVTHDQEEALELSEHVVLLEAGHVAQAGSPADLYDRPASPFVASFLGASAVTGVVQDGAIASVPAPPGSTGAERVQTFVRPHDVRLGRADSAEPGTPLARIDRLVRVGGFAKLWLVLPEGEPMSVQITKEELDALGVEPGDRVSLHVRDAKTFGTGYAI